MPRHQRARHRERRRPRLRRADQPRRPGHHRSRRPGRSHRRAGGRPGPGPTRPVAVRPRLSAHPARTPHRTRPGHVRPLRRRRFARLRRPREQDRLRLRDEPDGPALAEPPHPRPGRRRLRIPGAVTFPERRRLTVVVMGDIGPARRPRMHLAAWWLPVTTLVVLAAALVFIALNTSRTSTAKVGLDAILAAGVLMYAASGRLIASRRPDNAIGWLLGLIGLVVATSMFAEQYALYGLKTAPGAVPGPKVVGCLASVATAATVILLFFIVVLFPDGHLSSPRWRPVLWAMAVVFTGWGTQQFQAGTRVTGGFSNGPEAPRGPPPPPGG